MQPAWQPEQSRGEDLPQFSRKSSKITHGEYFSTSDDSLIVGFFLEVAPYTNVLAKSEYGITCVAITVTVVIIYLHTGIYQCANKGPSSQGYGFSSSHIWM